MAVRVDRYLAITWRKSSVSGTDADCVQVACYETSLDLSPKEPMVPSETPLALG
jgi:hypothetical protein